MFRVIHPNRYFFWAVALLVIFGIAVWGAVERLGIEEEITSQEIIVSSPISYNNLSGWKTYRNEEYGFEFQYPPTVVLSARDGESQEKHKISFGTDVDFYDTVFNRISGSHFLGSLTGIDVYFVIGSLPHGVTLTSYVGNLMKGLLSDETAPCPPNCLGDTWLSEFVDVRDQPTPIIINTRPRDVDLIFSKFPRGTSKYVFLSLKDDRFFLLRHFNTENYEFLEMQKELITQHILESFTIFDAVPLTQRWKTYRNNEYGFEIKYPLDFILISTTSLIYSTQRPPHNVVFLESPFAIKNVNLQQIPRFFSISFYKSEKEYLDFNKTQWNERSVQDYISTLENNNVSVSNTIIGGRGAYKIVYEGLGGYETYLFKPGPEIIEVTPGESDEISLTPNYSESVDYKIFQTIHFLK